MTNTTFQNGRKARNTWLAGKIKCGKCGYALKTTHNPSGYEYLRCSNVPSGPTTRAVRGAILSARRSLSSSFLPLWEKSSGSSSYCGAARKRQTRRLPPIRWSLHK
ncbi:recombinase zinc ribbon domain-containing protein [Blautia stercoris]